MDDVLAGLGFLLVFALACVGGTLVGAWLGWAFLGLLGLLAIAYLVAP